MTRLKIAMTEPNAASSPYGSAAPHFGSGMPGRLRLIFPPAFLENVVNHYDFPAVLHLFSLDPNRLTFKRNGTDQRLVENPGTRVVTEILA